MKLRLLSAAELEQVLPLEVAIEAMKRAFAELSLGQAVVPQRLSIPVAELGGTTLVKPALTPRALGAKLVSVFPQNRARGIEVTPGIMVLLSRETGRPECLCDGTYLTALRTGAAVGAASDLLARQEVETAALFGCGGQAPLLALAMDRVRQIECLRVYSRTRPRVERFVEEMQPRLRARLIAVERPDQALEGAALVCTATTSATPVFEGSGLAPGTHVNAIGSFTAEMQELDEQTVRRARVFVDSRSAAAAEAGELVIAQRAGATRAEEWTEIGEVVAGRRAGRRDDQEITLFKSVGLAVQDVEAARTALDRALAQGVGSEIEL